MCQQDASVPRYRLCPVASTPSVKCASVKGILRPPLQGDTYSGQVQDTGAHEGPSATVSSHATAPAAVLRLLEKTLCPPVDSNQLTSDAAEPSQAQKASPQGTRAPPAAAGKPSGQLPA